MLRRAWNHGSLVALDAEYAGPDDVFKDVTALRSIGYSGWYAWEDEPEDRNPFDSAVRNRRWIEKRVA